MSGEALPLLELTENTIRINQSNFQRVLNQVGSCPFVLYSINGATRTGKSYALNYFIRYLEAQEKGISNWLNSPSTSHFVWKSGIDPTTVGINLWSKPYFVQSNGQKTAILLMDCQGLFDKHTNQRQNAIIFSLSTLCSSVSIFNLMRNIDENVLQNLQFFSGYSNMVSKDSANQSFQKLIFLVRDFDDIAHNYGYHDAKTRPDGEHSRNFFRDIFLMDKTGSKDVPPENVTTREKIQSCYYEVGSFLLPDPGKNFRRDDNKMPDEDFMNQLQRFVQLVNSPSNLVVKKIGGQTVTGSQFIQFVDGWAKLCEKAREHFPDVQSVSDSTAAIQNSTATDTAMHHFIKETDQFMNENPGAEDSVFLQIHSKLAKEALEMFERLPRLENKEMKEKYKAKLGIEIEKRFDSNRQINLIKFESKLKEKMYKEEQAKRDAEARKMAGSLEKMTRENKETKQALEAQMKAAKEEAQRMREQANKEMERIKLEEAKRVEARMEAMAKENREARAAMEAKMKAAEERAQKMREEADRERERAEARAREVKQTRDTEHNKGFFESLLGVPGVPIDIVFNPVSKLLGGLFK